MRIEESLHCQSQGYKYSIVFSNYIVPYQVKRPGEQRLCYNIKKWEKDQFDILHDISENVTSVKFMDSIENVNHAASIVVYWIFYSN